MKKISITTLGCKVNQYESASFQTGFEKAGCEIVSADQDPDVVVINTCTVTGKAGAQSRQLIRRMARENPLARIVVTGCHAQLAAREVMELEELAGHPVCIVGNGNKHLLVETALNEKRCDLALLMGKITHQQAICELPVNHFGLRTRALLKVQDGCSSFCTYCIVPYTRGPGRSLVLEKVLAQARSLAEAGYREIVVTGIHVGMYGRDLTEGQDIVSLMRNLCEATPDVRYRLSSIEPLEVSESLLDLMRGQPNFMPHLHIPLQSGDDRVLKQMNRRYSTAQFREIIGLCRQKLEQAAIGIDVLVGFPGENEKRFETSYELLQQLDCTYLHVFPYSSRPGTVASTFDGQIDKSVKDERVARLRQLSDAKKRGFYDRMVPGTGKVLVESRRDKEGYLKGFSENYIPVHFLGGDEWMKRVVEVRLLQRKGLVVMGERMGEEGS